METFPSVLIITMILEEPEAGSSKIRESPGNSKSLYTLRRTTLHETEGDMAVFLFLREFQRKCTRCIHHEPFRSEHCVAQIFEGEAPDPLFISPGVDLTSGIF